MPLRDHFRLPVWKQASWEGFHGGSPMTMVQQLSKVLPDEFVAEPRVHLGTYFEIDVCAFESDDLDRPNSGELMLPMMGPALVWFSRLRADSPTLRL